MHETHITVVGNVATAVDYRESPNGDRVARFRLASTVRRYDQRRGAWMDGSTSFYTVWARRSLAVNIASSLSLGEPVIVQGQLRVHEKNTEGGRFVSADLNAHTVGHDLTRGTSAFMRVTPPTTAFAAASGAGTGVKSPQRKGGGSQQAAGEVPATGAPP